MYLMLFVVFLVFLLLAFSRKVANQYEPAVVFRLGRYRRTCGAGLYLLLPFVAFDAARLLRQAAETIMASPAGLELRRMQMITEVGAEQNKMTIIMMPSEFVDIARAIAVRGTTPQG